MVFLYTAYAGFNIYVLRSLTSCYYYSMRAYGIGYVSFLMASDVFKVMALQDNVILAHHNFVAIRGMDVPIMYSNLINSLNNQTASIECVQERYKQSYSLLHALKHTIQAFA